MLDAIIFDFDGVICESVEAKTEAFRKLFQDHPRYLDKILEFHMANGGMSRYEKFKIIYRDFLKRELTVEESRVLGQRFTQYSYVLVLKSAFVNGAYEFLNKYYRRFALFIVSGTPEEEMISIVRERNLERFFAGVYGSPRTKAALITAILEGKRLEADKVVFVGDSVNDYIGARETGIRFIGRVHPQHLNPFENIRIEKQIMDLTELDKWVQEEIK